MTPLAVVCVGVLVATGAAARQDSASGPASSRPSPPASNRATAPLSDAAIKQCLRLIGARRYDEARRVLAPAVSANPDWPRGNLLLAVTYHKQQQYDRARPLFERAVQLDPKDPASSSFYGWCLYYLGRPDAARKQFEHHLTLLPDYPDTHFALGMIALDRDDLTAARERFRMAIQLAAAAHDRQTEGKARIRLADLLIRTEQWADAREQLERALQLRPDAYGGYFKLSRVLQRLGDEAGAQGALEMHHRVRERVRPSASQAFDRAEPEGD